MEWLWAGLLAVSVADRRTRPLALLLGLKWFLNYVCAAAGLWLTVPLVDLALGAAGVGLALRITDARGPWLASIFVVVPVVHAWHWILWSQGIWVGVQYFALMLGLFTAQVVILSGPGVWSLVHGGVDRLAFAYRRAVAGVASSRRVRKRPGSAHR